MSVLSTFPIALASTAIFLSPAIADEKPRPGVISVSATGQAFGAPDMAILNLSVVREADTAREALNANTKAMSEVLAAMKERGIEDRDLRTSNFNIQPRYFYPKRSSNGEQKPPTITGYIVSNSLTVRVRDLTSVGAVLDQSVTLGVNQGGNLAFTVDKPDALIEQARKSAMEKAIAQARTLTGAAGVSLGRITQISEQGGFRPRRQKQFARMAESAVADATPVPVAAGENSYSVTVNVTWEIAQ
ncbi:SIMPL domain-containing protein [Pseudahrensia aquimaris]|uniref:SIMPL domain-containing protein n=1 Tax=Pseudahrensia aquimaris TaxID=744461 RepID=A0ABW3FCW6_9HYPH